MTLTRTRIGKFLFLIGCVGMATYAFHGFGTLPGDYAHLLVSMIVGIVGFVVGFS